jgi:probable phosphoglycerate mutase
MKFSPETGLDRLMSDYAMNINQPDFKRGVICLMRHGDSRVDDLKRFTGHTDSPLSETGRRQAEWWQKEFLSLSFDRIYCSDLSRSLETTRIICKGRKVEIQVLPELREINLGEWDGLPKLEVCRSHTEEYEKRGADLAGYRTPGGENFYDLSARVIPVFERIIGNMGSERVLIVGHAGVNRVILCHLLGMPLAALFRLGQDYCCLNVITSEPGSLCLRSINIPPGNSASRLL